MTNEVQSYPSKISLCIKSSAQALLAVRVPPPNYIYTIFPLVTAPTGVDSPALPLSVLQLMLPQNDIPPREQPRHRAMLSFRQGSVHLR